MIMDNDTSEITAERLDVNHELPAVHDQNHDQNEEGLASGHQATAAEKSPAMGIEQAKADEQCRTLLDRLARLQAEFDNSRKRAAREQREFNDFALAEALKLLLPILDNLVRAVETPVQDVGEFRTGIDLIRRQFEETLTKLGVKQIPAKGEVFDPRVHQAVETVDTTSAADNHVLEDLQRGYKLHDRLLRPAMVRVARNSKDGSQAEAA
jgi:molecular chaperone GrpE